ncbi:Riboflavin transporter [Roseivivax jejudonensis]|uniref:Riboflavin transporter n=1 Tax=Roseivivax jejudonensis TaxID=1529041 RepID=A0A1X7A229_9RHOB|nr:DMT family transporter [Roseivivax jejudonensis]SLN68290.1 Riboflavin transporter [Roseivivax jejudonensis]
MRPDNPPLGISLMLLFCLLAPLGDALAKIVGDRVPLLELVFLRFGVQVAILVPLVAMTRRAWLYPPRIMAVIGLRTLFHIGGIGLMFLSLRVLPLADAIAIAFVMPFVLLLLGWLVLGEEVGPRRLAACAVGFCGTLMVVQPAFAEVGPAALLPLGVAVFFALFMLATRSIARETDPVSLQAVSGTMAILLLGPAILVVPGAEFDWRPPGSVLPLILAMGALGTASHLVMTWSLRFAPGATLAPMQYLEIPIATFYGWAIFGDLPDGLALAGIAVTVAAGLYVILRERATMRAARQAPLRATPPPPPAE